MNRLVLLAVATAASAHAQTVLVKPYIQPGDGATLNVADTRVLTWVTDQKPGTFTVEYGWHGVEMKTAQAARISLDFPKYIPKPKPPTPATAPGAKPGTPTPTGKPGETAPAKPAETGTGNTTPKTGEVTKPAPAVVAKPGTATATTKPVPPAPAAPKPTPIPVNPPSATFSDVASTLDDLKDKVIETFKPIPEREQHYFRYRAVLPELPFDTEVTYRVRLGATVIREGTFKTRATATKPVRFVAVGDLASIRAEQYLIAYQVGLQKPDFLVALGDITYPGGRALQYMDHFWPCYNDVDKASPKTGWPLLATTTLYPVIGNHDADMQRLPDYPDAFSAFFWFSVPKNGPGTGPWNTPLGKDAAIAASFRTHAGPEYPAMSDYSFDYGPAHFLIIDSNSYATKEMDKIAAWMEQDLSSSKQPWKFVCTHQPPFQTSKEHYTEQRLRLFEPMFERCGVDVVFAGHVHNYQRSMPFKFTPNPPKRDPRGRVNGDFTLDQTFDGIKDTTPEGIIHIVSGGGGAKPYATPLEKAVEFLKKEHGANYSAFTSKYYVEKNSFSVIELTPKSFELRQINQDGKEIDHIKITK